MRSIRFAACLSVCILTPLLAPAPIPGQTPIITAAGDPSIAADTIYRLAVDPADYPEDGAIFLLNDAVVRLDADGRGTRTFRQVVQVLRQQVVAGYGERRLSYAPDHERLTLNWARVVRPDGEVISAEPAQMQESDIAAAIVNPVYVNRKEVRMSFGGVAVGTIIDISFTIEETEPYHRGDSYTHWNVSIAIPVRRSRFIFDVPANVQPAITERNLGADVAAVTDTNGRRSYSWTGQDVPKYRAEPFAPDTNSRQVYVVASLPTSWADIAQWYGGLAADGHEVTPEIETKVGEILTGAATRADTIRAVHGWVAQQIRYVSVSLGIGGYDPRTAAQTFTTGFGDCKDKTTLFIAVLRHLGITAYPVLLNSNGRLARREHPSIRQFNHVIAAVPEGDDLVFADLTAAYTPYGEVPMPAQGGFAVVVLDQGRSREMVLPASDAGTRRIAYEIVTEIAANGEMSGYMEERNSGPGFEARRSAFGVPLDSARAAAVMRPLLAIMPGARGDSIHGFNGRDLYAPVRYRVYFSGARGVARTGGAALFNFPFAPLPASARIAAIERLGARRTSIEAVEVLRTPPTTMEIVMRVTLPEGWRARVPESVNAESDFGSYAAEYSQEGRVLRIVRRERSATGLYPPDRLPDVVAFFRAAGADEHNRAIIIETGGQ